MVTYCTVIPFSNSLREGWKRASSDSVSNALEVGQEVLAHPSKPEFRFFGIDCLHTALISLGCEAEGLSWCAWSVLICSLRAFALMITASSE